MIPLPGMKAPQCTEGALAATAADRNCQSHLQYFFRDGNSYGSLATIVASVCNIAAIL